MFFKKIYKYLFRYNIDVKAYKFYECLVSDYSKYNNHFDDFRFDFITKPEILNDPIFKQNNRMERYLKYIDESYKCIGFKTEDNKIASYIWYSDFNTNIPFNKKIILKLPIRTAYIWDCRTSSKFKNKGLYKEGLKLLLSYLETKGIEKVYICNLVDNIYAEKTMKSLGFRLVNTLRVYFLFGFYMITGIYCRHLFSIGKYYFR